MGPAGVRTAELANFRYAVYGRRHAFELADVTCGVRRPDRRVRLFGAAARCTSAHTHRVALFFDANGIVESPKSAALRVTVRAARAGGTASAVPLREGTTSRRTMA